MSIYQDKNGYFYTRFKLRDTGKYTNRSLHTRDRAEAERLKEVYIREHRVEMFAFRNITLKNLRRDIENYCIKHKSKKTQSSYKIVFDGLESLLGNPDIKKILPVDIEKYVNELADSGKSNATINSYVRIIKAIFNKAVNKLKYLIENPAYEVEKLEEPEKQRAFTEREVNILAEGIQNEMVLNIFLFAIYTGCRLGEILNIQWKDIDFTDKTINVINNRVFKTKNRRNRQIPVSVDLHNIVKNIQDKTFGDIESNIIPLNNYLFCNSNGKKYLTDFISKSFKKYLRAFGFDEHYNFHSTRYTAASLMSKNGGKVQDIQKILGHSDIRVTMKYIKVPSSEMHDTVNNIRIEEIRSRYKNNKIKTLL